MPNYCENKLIITCDKEQVKEFEDMLFNNDWELDFSIITEWKWLEYRWCKWNASNTHYYIDNTEWITKMIIYFDTPRSSPDMYYNSLYDRIWDQFEATFFEWWVWFYWYYKYWELVSKDVDWQYIYIDEYIVSDNTDEILLEYLDWYVNYKEVDTSNMDSEEKEILNNFISLQNKNENS